MMTFLPDIFNCTGCGACKSICPKQAISIEPDEEGFLRPLVDNDKCIECHLCQKTCPSLRKAITPVPKQHIYALINNADRDLSSSGGAFSAFSRMVLNHGGIVFGATLDEKLQCRHIGIEKVEDLALLRGSKYVQSKIGDTFSEVKKNLAMNRPVLFSGTPCQVAGLYSYLGGNRYENTLITLDLVCHGVPNQVFFDAYISKLQKEQCNGCEIESFRFRKLDAWDYRPAYKRADTNHWIVTRHKNNAYMSAFFRGLSYRESCYQCKYANLNRVGTFTIADFWGIGTHGTKFNHDIGSGVSAVIDNYNCVPSLRAELEQYAIIEDRSLDEILSNNQNLNGPVTRPKERNDAVKDMLDMNVSLSEYSEKYKLLPKNRIKYWTCELFKSLIYSLNLYNFYKSISYRLK